MSAGRLRDKMTLQTATGETRGEDGSSTPVWADTAPVWAEILPLSSRESEIAKGYAATVSHRIRIYFRTDVATAQRLKLGNRIFAINGFFDPDQRRQFLDIYATESIA